MVKVVWPRQAIDDIDEIADYIEQFNPVAAAKTRARLKSLGDSLSYSPERGRPAPSGARELTTVAPYVLRYIVSGDLVVVIHVRHGRRRPVRG